MKKRIDLGKRFNSIVRFIIVWTVAIAICLTSSFALAQAQNNTQLAKEVYINTCSGCHVPLPAEVLPTATWEQILNNPDRHYGTSVSIPNRVVTQLLWRYLRNNSRPLIAGEATPEFVTNSRYLKALHPQVDLPKPTTHQSCNLCHPNAAELDYITLNSSATN